MISEKNFDISLNPSNTLTSDVPIKGKAYCRVFIDLVGEGSWQIVPDNTYDIINDVIVFPIQPTGKFVSLQVSTTPAELTQSPTENSMILTIKNEIKSVADNMENIINIASKVDVLVPNIVKIANVSDNILSVNNVSTNMTKVSNVDANMSDVDTVSTNILSVNNVSTNMSKVSNVDANMSKVSNVDANMLDINNAEENAQLAIQYKNLAQKWASELEDVVVADGKYSAYHWALKAYQLVTEGVINDITASDITTYSSNKLEELLALKANLLNPKFTESVSIGNIVLSPWVSTYSVIEGIDSSFYGNDGLNTIIGNNCYFNGTNWIYKNNGKATLQILSADNHTFKTTSSGSAGGVITWNTVATLGNDSVIVPYIQNILDSKAPLSSPSFIGSISSKGVVYKPSPVSITSWSYATTTITLNVASHTFIAGDYIEVSGLTATTYPANGIQLVTSVTSTTIVFTLDATPTGTTGVSSATVKGYATINGRVSESIGVNQTWQNVTASRALNVTYTNSTGKPIVINATISGNGAGTTTAKGLVNGIEITRSWASYTTSGFATGAMVTFIVPAGGTYLVDLVPSGPTQTLYSWSELK